MIIVIGGDRRLHRDLDVPAAVQSLQPHQIRSSAGGSAGSAEPSQRRWRRCSALARACDLSERRSTDSETRPRAASSSSAPTSSRRQPRSVRTSGSLAAVRARRRRSPAGRRARRAARRRGRPRARARARAPRPSAISGASSGCGAGRARLAAAPLGAAARARSTAVDQLLAAPAQVAAPDAADLLELGGRGGLALGDLDQRGVAEDALHGPVLARGGPLAPLAPARGRPARAGAQAAHARQALKIASGSRSSLARSSGAHSSRAHSRRPSSRQPPLQLVGQLEQVHDVLARVGQLLGRQRAARPSG